MPKEATLTIQIDNSKAKAARDEFLGMMTKMVNASLRQMKTLSKSFDDLGDAIPARKLAALKSSVDAGTKRFEKMKVAVSGAKKDSSFLTASLNKLIPALSNTGKQAKNTGDNFGKMGKKADLAAKKMGKMKSIASVIWSAISKLIGKVLGLAKAFGALAAVAGFNAIINAGKTFEKLEVTLFSVTGSVEAASAEMENMFKLALDFGVSIESISKSMVKLQAAAKDTDLGLAGANATMQAMLVTSRALDLATEDTKGAIYALQQMISKSTVSMEELKLQLGERIPGALNTAAKAMGMGVGEFKKLVEAGDLASDVFIRLFNIELVNKYFEGASKGSSTLQAKLDRLKTTMLQIFGEMSKAGIFDVFKGLVDEFTRVMVDNKDILVGLANQIAGVFDRILGTIQLADKEDIAHFFSNIVNSIGQLFQLLETLRQITMKIAGYFDIDVPKPDISEWEELNRIVFKSDHIKDMTDLGEIKLSTDDAAMEIAMLKDLMSQLEEKKASIAAKPVRRDGAVGQKIFDVFKNAGRPKPDFKTEADIQEFAQLEKSILKIKSHLLGLMDQRNKYVEQGRQIELLEQNIEAQTISALQGIQIELKKIDINSALDFSESKTLGSRLEVSRQQVTKFAAAIDNAKSTVSGLDLSGIADSSASADKFKAASQSVLDQMKLPGSDPAQLKRLQEVLQQLAAYGIAVKANSVLETEAADKTRSYSDKLDKLNESLKTTSDKTKDMWVEERRLNSEIAALNSKMISANKVFGDAQNAGLASIVVTSKHRAVVDNLNTSIATLTEKQKALAEVRKDSEGIGLSEKSFGTLSNVLGDYINLTTQMDAVKDKMNAGGEDTKAYTDAFMDLRLELAEFNMEVGSASFTDGYLVGIQTMLDATKNFTAEAGIMFGDFITSMSEGIGNITADVILFGGSFSEAFRDVAQSAIKELISSLVTMAVQFAISTAMAATFGAETKKTGGSKKAISEIGLITTATLASQALITSTVATSAAAIATAMAPAAAAASLASAGTNGVGAAAAITSVHALSKSMSGSKKIGGLTEQDSLYRIGEGTNPEVFKSDNGSQFFIPPERGHVVPMTDKDPSSSSSSHSSQGNSVIEPVIVPAPQVIINMDPDDLIAVMASGAGAQQTIETIESNASQIKSILDI